MSLYEQMYEPFCYVEKTHTPDGQGGYVETYVNGFIFEAVATVDTTLKAQLETVAKAEGVRQKYNIVTPRSVALSFHDVIKRMSDGKTFRITADNSDSKAPKMATFDLATVTAEEWELIT